MIKKLAHYNQVVAQQIYTVFQRSYQVEAQLIGVSDFPPLSRSVDDIQSADTLFFGFFEDNCLAAVIEIALEDKILEIDSLTVDPAHFRKGIANKLIKHVLSVTNYRQAKVETAVANMPAIVLYQKHGFVEYKRWTPSHGIEKVAMSLECSTHQSLNGN
ncbi:GNAT family N-acetyltransferase [Flocculibacter collagenilyticus]|uniref:GNAT family N-acetyltransferase n=1 Tax=Flocculibacter collagenilyticus TaxID=2744479 RepID=UPI0018F34EFB|nr:GNAT family N-acetyltransferase [Flocculibacter collagenilyticus]